MIIVVNSHPNQARLLLSMELVLDERFDFVASMGLVTQIRSDLSAKEALVDMITKYVEKGQLVGYQYAKMITSAAKGRSDVVMAIIMFIEDATNNLTKCCPLVDDSDMDSDFVYDIHIVIQMLSIVGIYVSKIVKMFSAYGMGYMVGFGSRENREARFVDVVGDIAAGIVWKRYIRRIDSFAENFMRDNIHSNVNRTNVEEYFSLITTLNQMDSDFNKSSFLGNNEIHKLITENPNVIVASVERHHKKMIDMGLSEVDDSWWKSYETDVKILADSPLVSPMNESVHYWFLKNYKVCLADRLLNHTTDEKIELQSLAHYCKANKMRYLETLMGMVEMIYDTLLSKKVRLLIEEEITYRPFVLRKSSWDLNNFVLDEKFDFPPELATCFKKIDNAYRTVAKEERKSDCYDKGIRYESERSDGERKTMAEKDIVWQPFMGSIVMEVVLNGITVQVSCLPIQSCVLLMFNTHDTVTPHMITDAYPLEKDFVDRMLRCMSNVSLLVTSDSVEYSVNHSYSGSSHIDMFLSLKSSYLKSCVSEEERKINTFSCVEGKAECEPKRSLTEINKIMDTFSTNVAKEFF